MELAAQYAMLWRGALPNRALAQHSDNSRAMCVCVICCYFVVLSGGGTGCNSTHITRATEMTAAQANGRYLLNVNKPFANEWASDSTLNIFVTSRSVLDGCGWGFLI
jgi:hypothetical protein